MTIISCATTWSITYGGASLMVNNYAPRIINYTPREH